MKDQVYFYVACTASLKQGINHGLWIDGSWDLEEINAEINRMLSSSLFYPETDWRITRYEVPDGFDFLGDQTRLDVLHEMAKFIQHFGEMGSALLKYYDGDVLEAQDAWSDRYIGRFDSIDQFVQMRIKQDYRLPGDILRSIDYQTLWQIWARKYYMALRVEEGRCVHIFRK